MYVYLVRTLCFHLESSTDETWLPDISEGMKHFSQWAVTICDTIASDIFLWGIIPAAGDEWVPFVWNNNTWDLSTIRL